jgi:hypothetical protein
MGREELEMRDRWMANPSKVRDLDYVGAAEVRF